MGRIVLVTGGARSGKSFFAQSWAEGINGRRVFIATCPPIDEELEERIQRHRAQREGRGWHRTIEETLRLKDVLREAGDGDVILVDCLGLWINNLLYDSEQSGATLDEDEIAVEVQSVLEVCRALEATVVFVTNEVGCGLVPAQRQSRLYRDLLGRCNQVVGAQAETVALMVCGQPLFVKSGG